MKNVIQWANAVLAVAYSSDMKNDQIIDTWPADVADHFPKLTVGDVRTLLDELERLESWAKDGARYK